ncbi:pyrroloquinoline quinone precursor peptide PqqA [Streptomyces sp. 796.1]|uniref:pyrroloquinoline quinone precursor peptide PqqA n=1 Tax=Streptomyces sp. 796.1 TaxID=3163029 RepID=UPI0039C90BC4
MSESVQQAVEQQARSVDPAVSAGEGATGWQTPDYTVVETGLEVTAYSLNNR